LTNYTFNNHLLYFTGKLRKFYFTKGSQDGYFLGKIGLGNPWWSKILKVSKKYIWHKSIVFWDENTQRNWVFATKLNFMITLSLQPYDVILWYLKVKLFDLTECIGCKDIGIRKSEFVAKTQFLCSRKLKLFLIIFKKRKVT